MISSKLSAQLPKIKCDSSSLAENASGVLLKLEFTMTMLVRFRPRLGLALSMTITMLGIMLMLANTSNASDSTQQLQSAVHRMNARLGSGETADGWRRYLLLNVLETQSAKGEQADMATLQLLHQRFSSGAAGLDHPIFDDVRVALENQIDQLNAARIVDLSTAVHNVRSQFAPIGDATIGYYRALAVRELEMLKIYYRQEYSSRDRADAFYTLQLDEAAEFLQTVKFEFAPEVSVGKMNSMIRDVKEQRGEVIRAIDALPFDDGNDDEPSEATRPLPDDEPTLAELEDKKQRLDARLRELAEQRNEIRKSDAPRAKLRAVTFRKLLGFEKGFADTAENFRDPYIVSAQLALERFVRIYYYGTADNLQEDFLIKITKLSEELQKLGDPSERLAAGEIGRVLEWLEITNQVPHLVTAIRARYSLPNVYVSIAGELLDRVSRSESNTRPIRENISGRLVRGTATTHVQSRIDVIDDPNQVHLSIEAYADVNSSTYLQQGKIFAYVDAAGQATARRSLFVSLGGLLAGEPYASANMNTFFRGTSSNCNLVNRIAAGKYSEGKTAGDVAASARVRQELLERFTSETQKPVTNGREALAKARKKSLTQAAYVPELYMHSASNRIHIVGKKSSRSTLAAIDSPVVFGVSSHLEVRLHDTVLSNYVDPIFSGKTFTNQELSDELESLLGQKPDALTPKSPEAGEDVPAEDESFSITFAQVRPVQFQFDQNMISVIVTGTRFSQADKQIRAGLTIKLQFRITRANGELKLERVGKAELDFLDPESKDAKIVAFRSFLDGRLNSDGDIKQTAVDLPPNLIPIDKIDALKDRPAARDLQLSQCRIEGGWFYLGWNVYPAGNYQTFPIDLPAVWTKAVIDQMDSIHTSAHTPNQP
jgi:hypothetical protein